MKFYVLLLLLISSFSAAADDLGYSKEWLRLLNYKKNIFGGYTSEADGKNFFLTPNGKTNPSDEFQALKAALLSQETVTNDHIRCRFPARSTFIAQKLNIPLTPESKCPEFEKFKNSFDAESVSLVFSAYYINNPSSTFGHTFLRVNRKRNKNSSQNTELLDLGVNFAANPWTNNPMIFTFGGIIGLFPGIFSTMPYYYKVREYNDFDSRDLWSYKLNLTPNEIDQFVRHLWELGQTYYDYFFFTENCSYHIFTALEAAAPRFDLTKNLPYWAIPSDTILVAAHTPQLVNDIHFRASARNVFLARYSALNDKEQDAFLKYKDTDSANLPIGFNRDSELKLVDTNLDWIEYKYSNELQNKKSPQFLKKNELLIKRTEYPPETEYLKIKDPSYKPHEGHPSMRYGLEPGYSETFKSFQRYHIRFALHDWMDPDFGYPENMQIEFFNVILQSNQDFKKWNIDNWTFISVKSLAPFEKFEKKPSWELLFGIKSYQDEQCEYCQAGYITNSWGIAYDFFPHTTFYAFVTGDASFSQKYRDESVRMIVGPKLGVLFKPRIDFKVQLEGAWYWDPFQEYYSYESEFSLRKALSIEYAIGVSAKVRNDITEGSVQFFWYH